MRFSRLKLNGFKSFVETTELFIEPGLTGIVGPNGCGKSNVVEGLRWAMGETSAKQLRGGDMYDVIFAGTSNRTARNVADVTITLENKDRTAPSPFNETDEIVVSRRIERDKGSVYRINGRDVRARDVQLLFADAATGARSPALVSQGKIGALINAKPSERRVLLEDAAGIGGLHARRHESELKLKQAEANLTRLDDILETIEARVNSLMRQVRQAARYRDLSDEIRRLEALRYHLRWVHAAQAVLDAESLVTQTQVHMAEAAQVSTAADTARAHAAADLPPLRKAEAEASAKFLRLQTERDVLARDLTRLETERNQAQERLAQLEADRTREDRQIKDAELALHRLAEERTALDAATRSAQAAAAEATATPQSESLEDRRAALEAEAEAKTRALADAEARKTQLLEDAETTQNTLQNLKQQLQNCQDDLAALPEAAGVQSPLLKAVDDAEHTVQTLATEEQALVTALESERITAQTAIDAAADQADTVRTQNAQRSAEARALLDATRQDQKAARETAQEAFIDEQKALEASLVRAREDGDAAIDAKRLAAQTLSALTAEAEGLKRIVATSNEDTAEAQTPVLDALNPEPGFEAALAAALGEDLQAPIGNEYERGWSFAGLKTEKGPDLPGHVSALADHVTARGEAASLLSRLAAIGVVDTADAGASLVSQLTMGQRLVSRDGHLWRWDGFYAAPGASASATETLHQRARLTELETEITHAEQAVASADQALTLAQQTITEAQTAIADAALRMEQALEAFDAQASDAENKAQSYWDTIQLENSAREGQAIMAVRAARDAAADIEKTGRERLQDVRQRLGAAQTQERSARTQLQQAQEKATAHAADRARLETAVLNTQNDISAAQTRVQNISDEQQASPDLAVLQAAYAQTRSELTHVQEELAQQLAQQTRAAEDAANRKVRISAIDIETESWQTRLQDSAAHSAALVTRLNEAKAHLNSVEDAPETLQAKLKDLDVALTTATEARAHAASALSAKEEEAHRLEVDANTTRENLQRARENHVRAEAGLEQAQAHMTDVLDRIAEDLAVPPEHLASEAQIEGAPHDVSTLPDLKQTEIELDRVKRQREAIGPVNLRAEVELKDIEEEFTGLRTEKDDLVGAIARLRTAIDEINSEGRERLLNAFAQVNGHFEDLFTRLFGGGTAHLALIEDEDPLAAGLEVMASPPGKKLQSMSLLSGGEQALTALSLLFAVFLVNPAPICVLDEVDAPLDDANVERFCNLLDQMARYRSGDQETRFLVVSHHPLTMSRMNRLFGVTMSERGVSTLVSVDLERTDTLKAIA